MYKIEALRYGEKFHRAANTLIPDDLFDVNDDWYWFVPSIVNMSFACECYLKSLLSDGENQSSGHRLNELFSKLPKNIQDEVMYSAQFEGDEDFSRKLEENSSVFVEWRYAFERRKEIGVDIIFLEGFAAVLHKLAEQRASER